MAVYKNLNCAFAVYNSLKLPAVKDGDIITASNLAQMEAGTVIFDGVKDLTFEDCNLVNVKMDASWRNNGGNNFQGTYDPAQIFPDEKVAQEQAAKDGIKQAIIDKYAAEVEKQIAPLKASEIDPKTLEASVIAAVSAKARP